MAEETNTVVEQETNVENQNTENQNLENDNKESKTFTQDELDNIIQKRLDKESKKHAKELKALQDKLPKNENVNEEQTNQPSESELKAQKALQTAQKAIIKATAKAEALNLKIDPKYIDAAIKLANFSDIDVGDDLTVDNEDIQNALKDVLKNVPVFALSDDSNSKGFQVGKEINNKKDTSKSGILDKVNSNAKPWNRFK